MFHRIAHLNLWLLLIAIFSQSAMGNEAPTESEVAAAISGYLDAIHSGDSKRAASYWSDSGQWVMADGKRLVGRGQIEKELARFTEESPEAKIILSDVSIRFLTSTVAMEEGTSAVAYGDEVSDGSTYEAIHVRREGGWKLESLREFEGPTVSSNYEHLRQLEWLIGDWGDSEGESSIETSCQWTRNKNFITRTFRISVPGQSVLEGTQIIGWDAKANTIRSWVFDSDGGFGSGIWHQEGGKWTIQNQFQRADGTVGHAGNTLRRIDDTTIEISSNFRMMGSERLPDLPPTRVSRAR